MQVDVFGMADIPRLDKFLCDRPVAFLGEFTSQESGGVAFSGICIDTGDKNTFCFIVSVGLSPGPPRREGREGEYCFIN